MGKGRKTNSSPGLGGCMWPCCEARVVLKERRGAWCFAAAATTANGRTDDCSRIRSEEERMLWKVIRAGRTEDATSLGKTRVRVRGVAMVCVSAVLYSLSRSRGGRGQSCMDIGRAGKGKLWRGRDKLRFKAVRKRRRGSRSLLSSERSAAGYVDNICSRAATRRHCKIKASRRALQLAARPAGARLAGRASGSSAVAADSRRS